MANIISDSANVRKVDILEKNKFRYEWLSKSINIKLPDQETEVLVGDCVQKVDVSGKAICSICNDFIYYGKRGYSAISDHIKTKKHRDKVFLKKSNYTLPSSLFCTSSVTNTASTSMSQNVPLCDRVLNSEALVLGVLAQHSLPFSMAEVIIDVSKALSQDKKALNHLNMKRASATYKMRFGVAKTFLQTTIENLRTVKFSLNVDEATSSNQLRVVSILCSYFSPIVNRVVVEHLASLSVNTVSAEKLFEEITKFLDDNNIPWENLMSILMDSCNVMRGSKTGLETRIRNEKAPHLLDVDGDSCHHIHNACKRFCKPFNKWVENCANDLCNDIQWSADIKACLSEICGLLGVKFVSPVKFIPHRWLSCYDVAMNFLYLLDSYTILYYSFLNNNDKTVYFSILCSIYKSKNVSSSERANVKDIQRKLSMKKMTDDGEKRKKRIIEKLFYYRKKTILIINFYIAALPLLKRYILLFQTREPMIHKIYDEQKQLFLDFLSCFVAQQNLQIKTTKMLLEIDLCNKELHLPLRKMFLGTGTENVISNLQTQIVEDFLICVREAYVECAKHLQKKLPFDNQLLRCASSIDPTARGHQITCQRLQKLPSLLQNVLSLEEKEKFSLEIFQYQVDIKLPPPIDDSRKIIPVDIWWSEIFCMPKYSSLSKIVKAVLSCFHGPQIEGTFSMMGDIIDKKSGRMQIQTYSAIQTVKHKLLAEKKSAVDYFNKKDFLHQPVDGKLCHNLRSSRMFYQMELDEKRKLMEAKKNNIHTLPNMKKKIGEICFAEKAARLKHKRKLELMLQKIKAKKLKSK